MFQGNGRAATFYQKRWSLLSDQGYTATRDDMNSRSEKTSPAPSRPSLFSVASRLRIEGDWLLVVIAGVIGMVMGGVAFAYISIIQLCERWHEWGHVNRTLLLVLVAGLPGLGALLTGIITHYVKAPGQGPGVSAVMYSVHREGSRLPLRLAFRKWITSTLTIGSGGSAGAEGPIVTIGSTIGSNVGQWLRVDRQNTATLLGCGAAAGISSVFNAPFAGILFVLEVLLRDFSLRTLTPIVIAAVVAATWTQMMLGGNEPLFGVAPEFFSSEEAFTLFEVPNYLLLGIVCGVVGAVFVRSLFWAAGAFERIRIHPALLPAVGGLMLGVIGVVYVTAAGRDELPPFFGNGYPVIKQLLDPSLYFADVATRELQIGMGLFAVLCLIVMLKLVATCLTIGSGGSGGLFAPSLLIGAATGGAFGVLVSQIVPSANPGHYALVGMAAMVASTTHAPLTGILIVYEMTRSEGVLLPLMFAAVISVVMSRVLSRDSVYTWKLTRMGLRIGAMSDLTILRRLVVSDVPLADAITVKGEDAAQRLIDISMYQPVSDFVVADDDRVYEGMVVGNDLRTAMLEREAIPFLLVHELERTDLPTVNMREHLDVVLERFSRFDVHSLAVVDDTGRVQGLITRERLMRRYQEALAEE
ncbi:MAG: chloride channel protein [Phycisphaerales bacterium]